jgi:phosphoribosylformylglycinamidine synthase
MIREGVLASAHDVSDGGLAICLAESCILGAAPIGATIRVYETFRRDAVYFGESQSRIVVSCAPAMKRQLVQIAMEHDVELQELGTVGGTALRINDDVSADTAAMNDAYRNSLDRLLSRQ